jgi:hypothetical protein
MSKSAYFRNALLLEIFNGDERAIPDVIAQPNLWVSLHTELLGDSADQSTDEVAYTGYTRVAVPRTGEWWNVGANAASLLQTINFPLCTAPSSAVVVAAGIGLNETGAGRLLYRLSLSNTIQVQETFFPSLLPDGTITET